MRRVIFVLLLIYFTANSCFAGFLTSSVDDEAYAKGRKYFSKRIVFCNGKYYMKGLSLIELEGLEFYINPGKISEADKKNGIEWSGRFSFEATTYRELNENFEWGIYKDWNSQLGRLSLPTGIFDNSIGMLKLNGIWYLNEEPNKEKLTGLNKALYDIQKKEEIKELNISCGEPPEYIIGELKKLIRENEEKKLNDKKKELNILINKSKKRNFVVGQYRTISNPTSYHKNKKMYVENAIITDVDVSYIENYTDRFDEIKETNKVTFWFGNIKNISRRDDSFFIVDIITKITPSAEKEVCNYSIFFDEKTVRDDFFFALLKIKWAWNEKYPKLK